jgi:hypothetical protein
MPSSFPSLGFGHSSSVRQAWMRESIGGDRPPGAERCQPGMFWVTCILRTRRNPLVSTTLPALLSLRGTHRPSMPERFPECPYPKPNYENTHCHIRSHQIDHVEWSLLAISPSFAT